MPYYPVTPISQARRPEDLATLAFAGVIAEALRSSRLPLIRGLSESCFQKLLQEFFSDLAYSNGDAAQSSGYDEFDEIVEQLAEHRVKQSEQESWLAHALAS